MFDLATVGVLVILVGFLLILVATLVSGRSGRERGEESRSEVRGGGVVMIGPIPIIFGTDAKWASFAIALAIILVVVSFVLMQYGVFSR